MQKYKKQRQVLLEIGSITRVILGNMHRQLLTTLVGRPYDQCVVEFLFIVSLTLLQVFSNISFVFKCLGKQNALNSAKKR